MTSVEVPGALPNILKDYVKAAILAQPEDILKWSSDYFKTSEHFPRICQNNYKIQNRALNRILVFQVSKYLHTYASI